MSSDHYLVTGSMGCIGSWVVSNLVASGEKVTAFDLAEDPRRMRLLMKEDDLSHVNFVKGDITDPKTVDFVVLDGGITKIIHLAALQVPFCKADPLMGARVNVDGTINVFEAAKNAGLKQVVYASSIAVYGEPGEYPPGPLQHDAVPAPKTHYGVYKFANEGNARIYWNDDGIASIGLRPYIVYGPGRDQGLTSDPTKAILSMIAGKPFQIEFGGKCVYHFAGDVADAFIRAANTDIQGAEAYNLGGHSVHMSEIVAAIETAIPAALDKITIVDKALPFPENVDDSAVVAKLGQLPNMSLADGMKKTAQIFENALNKGLLSVS